MPVRRLALLVLLAAGPAAAQHGAPPADVAPPPALSVDRPYGGPEELIFISPAGEPFRGPADKPYPVAAWFAQADKDKDGVLTRAEFVADALAFFDRLDADKDGFVDGFENGDYERTIAPEINGVMRPPDAPRARGWNPFSRDDAELGRSLLMSRDGDGKRGRERRRQGAAQYGLLNEPHPVRGADADLDQKVSRAEAEVAARRRFDLLDKDHDGRLIPTELPPTPMQWLFERAAAKK